MKRTSRELHVRHAFADALSGEFKLADDLDHSHTLSRLARAAYLQGTANEGVRTSVFGYSPTWCEAVMAITGCEVEGSALPRHYLDQPTRTYILSSLALSKSIDGEVVSSVAFVNDSNLVMPNADDIMTIYVDGDVTRFPLGLGDELTEARDAATQTAHDFFNQAVEL